MFIVAVLTIGKLWKQPKCPSIEWRDKQWCTQKWKTTKAKHYRYNMHESYQDEWATWLNKPSTKSTCCLFPATRYDKVQKQAKLVYINRNHITGYLWGMLRSGYKRAFWSDGNVQYLDWCGSYMDWYIYQNLSRCRLKKIKRCTLKVRHFIVCIFYLYTNQTNS